MKVACVLAPHLPVQVERKHDPSLAGYPLIIGGRSWDLGAVLDCCPLAKKSGVMAGMRLSQARALCPTAHFLPARERAYRAAHERLVDVISNLTPTRETAYQGLLYAEVSGLERRLGPDSNLACYLVQEAERASGLDVQVGLGKGKFIAEQAARTVQSGQARVVANGEEQAFLSQLPLTRLPLDPEVQRRLAMLGLHTLGELVALPRETVVHQFGPHTGVLYDLSRGIDPRPVHADAPPLVLESTHAFAVPITDQIPLLAHLEQVASELAETTRNHGYQAEGLRLCLKNESGKEQIIGSPVKPPSANEEKLKRLANSVLGKLAPDTPIAALTLTFYPLRPFHLGVSQLALFDGTSTLRGLSWSRRQERLHEVLHRLRVRFGEVIVLTASLLEPPAPRCVQVTTGPENSPLELTWHNHTQKVVTVYEFWRERTRWWSQPVERDYFRLETSDGQVRVIFRDLRAGQWLLERRHI